MQTLVLIFARRGNPEINKWLGEHPLVLGLIFLVLGGLLLGWGAYELRIGEARGKRGQKLTGGVAKASSIVRVVVGAGFCLFALYKIIAG